MWPEMSTDEIKGRVRFVKFVAFSPLLLLILALQPILFHIIVAEVNYIHAMFYI